MSKIKAEIEMEVDGRIEWEFVRHGAPEIGEYFLVKLTTGKYSAMMTSKEQIRTQYAYPIVKQTEPAFELETDFFALDGEFDDAKINAISSHSVYVSITDHLAQAEARDLAKILTYWAENGRLPDRVVVKEDENE